MKHLCTPSIASALAGSTRLIRPRAMVLLTSVVAALLAIGLFVKMTRPERAAGSDS